MNTSQVTIAARNSAILYLRGVSIQVAAYCAHETEANPSKHLVIMEHEHQANDAAPAAAATTAALAAGTFDLDARSVPTGIRTPR